MPPDIFFHGALDAKDSLGHRSIIRPRGSFANAVTALVRFLISAMSS